MNVQPHWLRSRWVRKRLLSALQELCERDPSLLAAFQRA